MTTYSNRTRYRTHRFWLEIIITRLPFTAVTFNHTSPFYGLRVHPVPSSSLLPIQYQKAFHSDTLIR
ncbi:hypothetical protein RJT34_32345 [Clitoria ternatea]|uniref:Uncharacterized protein n=1 Tax=Clitoria ternatea TaxID=43366 RepID=A0AAN9F042_CLITE